MGLKDKIDEAISEQKILLEAKMQYSEDKIETYLAEQLFEIFGMHNLDLYLHNDRRF